MKITQLAPQSQFLSGSPTGPAGGDAGGTYPNPTVAKIQGNPICANTPSLDDVLTWDGTAWCPAPAAGGMTNPMTTAGDVIYGGTAGLPTRLGAGTAGYVLTANGAGVAPSWQAPAAAAGIWRPLMDGAGAVVTDGATGEAVMAYGPA